MFLYLTANFNIQILHDLRSIMQSDMDTSYNSLYDYIKDNSDDWEPVLFNFE